MIGTTGILRAVAERNCESVPFYPFFRTDDSRSIEYNVVRKLVKFTPGIGQCRNKLYFQVDGTELGPHHCNNREPESWNDNHLNFRAKKLEIIYRVTRPNVAGGKFWIQIQGNLYLNI